MLKEVESVARFGEVQRNMFLGVKITMIVPITKQSLGQTNLIDIELEKHRHLPLLKVVKPTGIGVK